MVPSRFRVVAVGLLTLLLAIQATAPTRTPPSLAALTQSDRGAGGAGTPTQTPITHLVVIYQENRSFDHIFGTYPIADNPPGQPPFVAAPGTPSVNGLTETLLTRNPNLANPFRLDRTQAFTCDHQHEYVPEQRAYNCGLVDRFIQEIAVFPTTPGQYCPQDAAGRNTIVMGYYDGNTVTALWNYAQHFAISDNFYGTTFGPSTLGALNLVGADNSGVLRGPPLDQYGGVVVYGDVPLCGEKDSSPASSTAIPAPRGATTGTNVGDPDPFWDICSVPDASLTMALGNRNIGDLLNEAGVTWGLFQGGFELSADGTCASAHPREAYDRAIGVDPSTDPHTVKDYIAHHNPFQYYASTANPRHLPPSSVEMVGRTDQANHQYDLAWLWRTAEAGNLPAVSFVVAPAYQDGHPGYSDLLEAQQLLVETINFLQTLPEWRSMAIIVAWDDGGGWYDHVMPPIVNQSATPLDLGCGEVSMDPPARCGYGPRLPFLLISPYAKQNYVGRQLVDQSSITRFIEDNWLGGRRLSATSFDSISIAGSLHDLFDFTQAPTRTLFLDPSTGLSVQKP